MAIAQICVCKFYCFPHILGRKQDWPPELNTHIYIKRLGLKRGVYGLPNCFDVDVDDAAKLTRSAVLSVHAQSEGLKDYYRYKGNTME